jgi:hypothetical protein
MFRREFLKGAAALGGTLVVNPAPLMAERIAKGRPSGGFGPSVVLEPGRFDVVVVGAGPGGIPAAVRAARSGARVALVEEDNHIGGAPVDMYVTSIFGAPPGGLSSKMQDDLTATDSISVEVPGVPRKGGRFFLPSAFCRYYNALVAAEKNITLFSGSPVIGALVREKGSRNIVKGVRIFRGGAVQDLLAAVTIDATGTGVVAEMAGCDCMYGADAKSDFGESIGYEQKGGPVQRCTQMFISQRIKKDAIFPEGVYGHGAEDGWIGVEKQSREEKEARGTGIYWHWGQPVDVEDTRDPVAVAEAQRWCLEQFRDKYQAIHDAGWAVHIAPKLGVREVRRVRGEYILTGDDVILGNWPDDTIAEARYGLDCWGMKQVHRVKTKPYGIPYRSLIPLGYEGILTAGRVISGTHLAMSSYRVQRICSHIGEAAGTAAAMAALSKTGVRDIDVELLKQKSREYGITGTYQKS